MTIQLAAEDFERLVQILSTMPDFQIVQNRVDFVTDVFAGSPRKHDIVASLNLDGHPRGVAVRVIERLSIFGQDEPGRETVGVLINKMLAYKGGGSEAEYLYHLMLRYPFHTPPAAWREMPKDWHGHKSLGQVQEQIIGENTLRDIFMLEMAVDAAKAVARIVTPTALGTGFMITGDLIMTNNHVIRDNGAAEQSQFFFNYQIDRHGKEQPVQICLAKQGGLFYTNAELDFAIIELRDKPNDFTPLPLKAKRVMRDERVSIIQHPGGHYKKISIQNNFVAYADVNVVQYTTSTEPGSSGSPVFNNTFEVIAIHHSGGELVEPGTRQRYLRNAGTSMIAVLEDLQRNAPEIAKRLKD